MSKRFRRFDRRYLDRHQRVAGCKAALENEGWCLRSDLALAEACDIVEAWRQEDDDLRRIGIEVTNEYGIREAQMDGLDIWEAYII